MRSACALHGKVLDPNNLISPRLFVVVQLCQHMLVHVGSLSGLQKIAALHDRRAATLLSSCEPQHASYVDNFARIGPDKEQVQLQTDKNRRDCTCNRSRPSPSDHCKFARQMFVSVQAAVACALFVTHQNFVRTAVGCIFRNSERRQRRRQRSQSKDDDGALLGSLDGILKQSLPRFQQLALP